MFTFKELMHAKVCEFKFSDIKLNPKKWKRLSFKKTVRNLAILIIFLGALFTVKDEIEYQFGLGIWGDDNSANSEVAGLKLAGA
jgi:hypothetical protein